MHKDDFDDLNWMYLMVWGSVLNFLLRWWTFGYHDTR